MKHSFTLQASLIEEALKYIAPENKHPALASLNFIVNDDDSITIESTDSYRAHVIENAKLNSKFPEVQSIVKHKQEREYKPLPLQELNAIVNACKDSITMMKRKAWDRYNSEQAIWFHGGDSYITLEKSDWDQKVQSIHKAPSISPCRLNANYLLEALKGYTKKGMPSPTIYQSNPNDMFIIKWILGTHYLMPLKYN